LISLAVFMIGSEFLSMPISTFPSYTYRDLPPTSGMAVGNYRLTLDYARAGRGVGVFALMTTTPEGGRQTIMPVGDASGRFGGGNLVNYLFVPSAGAPHWLFSNNSQAIATTIYFTDQVSRQVAVPQTPIQDAMRAAVYDVIPNGTQRHDLYIAKPDGAALTKIVAGADDSPAVAQLDGGALFISYRSSGRVMAVSVTLADFKIGAAQDLVPLLPK